MILTLATATDTATDLLVARALRRGQIFIDLTLRSFQLTARYRGDQTGMFV